VPRARCKGGGSRRLALKRTPRDREENTACLPRAAIGRGGEAAEGRREARARAGAAGAGPIGKGPLGKSRRYSKWELVQVTCGEGDDAKNSGERSTFVDASLLSARSFERPLVRSRSRRRTPSKSAGMRRSRPIPSGPGPSRSSRSRRRSGRRSTRERTLEDRRTEALVNHWDNEPGPGVPL